MKLGFGVTLLAGLFFSQTVLAGSGQSLHHKHKKIVVIAFSAEDLQGHHDQSDADPAWKAASIRVQERAHSAADQNIPEI